MNVFEVPADLRAFIREVVANLDSPKDGRVLDAEDAFQNEVGYGGRFEHSDKPGGDLYRFHYITPDGHYKWELVLRDGALRSIADGMLTDCAASFDNVLTFPKTMLTRRMGALGGDRVSELCAAMRAAIDC